MHKTWRDHHAIRWLRTQLLRLAHELDPDAGAMSEAAYQAYLAQRTAEMPARQALNWRWQQAMGWVESNFTSLEEWRRVVDAIEGITQQLREEERDREPCRRTRERQPFRPSP